MRGTAPPPNFLASRARYAAAVCFLDVQAGGVVCLSRGSDVTQQPAIRGEAAAGVVQVAEKRHRTRRAVPVWSRE